MSNTAPVIVHYTGNALKEKITVSRFSYDFNFEGSFFKGVSSDKILVKNELGKDIQATEDIDPYIPDDNLKEAIEMMQILERPLLLRGEPGCGKTKVAQAYAFERYKDVKEGYRRFYYEWHVKSSSKAQDGLYQFDHIARLRNANAVRQAGAPAETKEELIKYRELGPLGKAFLASEPGNPAILLIDEIDKADIDFPNDLLLELDEMRFVIRETGEEIIPKCRPLIFITSNQERELPQAFLRRCLFHFIKFPEAPFLKTIMIANFPQFKKNIEENKGVEYVTNAIERFGKLRETLKNNPTANKNVSTSELKDWIKILVTYFEKDPADAKIDITGENLPFYAALLKTENDLKSVGKFETVK